QKIKWYNMTESVIIGIVIIDVVKET
ncbi:MAG: hypothetical protein H6Q59_637, partial [Firmicutes bacterium]|nr:hypothetical protein [Bacillota bacterium]